MPRFFPGCQRQAKLSSLPRCPSTELQTKAVLELPRMSLTVPPRGTASARLQGTVKDRLKLWNSADPNLYGLVVNLHRDGKKIDSKYSRFGWRQITIRGAQIFLNGAPLILRGDSWHFMGIPQMSRRYAWAWFTALQRAGLNAVRLHAQPRYPAFYLDIADEMGILVLTRLPYGPAMEDPSLMIQTSGRTRGAI